MEKLPPIIQLKITSKCNHNCKYCYDFGKGRKNLTIKDIKKIIKFLKNNGAKEVVITGGEPLIRKDISNILGFLNTQKLKIHLDTNGDHFFKYLKEINKYIHSIGLPLDYNSNKVSYRGKKNFETVLKILNYFSSHKKPKIRIHTVATKENIRNLNGIGELLTQYPVDIWKIMQFLPLGNGKKHMNELSLPKEEFEKSTKQIREKYSKYFKIAISKKGRRGRAYFFIAPDGVVFLPPETEEGEYLVIGKIFDQDIIKRWKNEVNKKKYEENISKTYKF